MTQSQHDLSHYLFQTASYNSERDTPLDIEHDSHVALLTGIPVASRAQQTFSSKLRAWRQSRLLHSSQRRRYYTCSRRSLLRAFTLVSYAFFATLVLLILLAFAFFPSYTYLPPHYADLRNRVSVSSAAGLGNPQQQKIFIAATLFDPDGKLASGDWADNVLALIHLLGPENTYLSIYENDSGPDGQKALTLLGDRVPCQHTLVSDNHLGLEGLPQVMIPDGSKRVKRISYLAEVRNRALAPLDLTPVLYDKILYLNDVVFNPVDALQLLFSTNQNSYGQADYRAACAVDFVNPFKFYDTFATRDAGGYQMGVPFFPWFALGGDSRSHSDVVSGKDAVRVRSCWGGMVAYDGRFLQKQPHWVAIPETAASEGPSNLTAPYRFRAEADMFWDASECCLIQADIANPDPDNTEIYMNPFVRVAYDSRTLSWLWFTRRFEALYTPIHIMIDIMVSMPHFNPRRDERAWETVVETVWVPDFQSPSGGAFENVSRVASHSGFCGRRKLPVMKSHFLEGEKNYEFIPIPSGSV
ncbi:hypothetical protein DV736_g2246, partial [Chaetothyriales sp. CBS 134916]